MLRDRVVTASVLASAFLAALFWLPAVGWTALAAVVFAIAAWEWAGFARRTGAARAMYAAVTAAAGVAAAVGLNLANGAAGTIALVPVYGTALMFWVVVAPLWLARSRTHAPPALILAFGWIVLLPTFLALVHLRNLDPVALLLFMATVWMADIAAYFVGRQFGRHKLAPLISPGKTWEGLCGAAVATGVYALAWIALLHDSSPALVRDLPWSAAWMLVLVEVLTLLSVIGDLFESAMKRQAGLKDSGALLPGHGGLLDRIDALTAVLPAAALVSLV
jgi:phosphatidate cytidylyltransferase